jgi:hypothetical protein
MTVTVDLKLGKTEVCFFYLFYNFVYFQFPKINKYQNLSSRVNCDKKTQLPSYPPTAIQAKTTTTLSHNHFQAASNLKFQPQLINLELTKRSKKMFSRLREVQL